jgi:hypothetical protein
LLVVSKISTFIIINDKKVEKTFLHITKSNPFHLRIAVADLPFVVASSCPAKDKESCLAGNHEKDEQPNAHREPSVYAI